MMPGTRKLASVAAGSAMIALVLAWPCVTRPSRAADPPAAGSMIDPMGPNSACYVCHMTFVREELSKVHLAAKVPCIKCHGLSDKHANDENIGATKPDRTYKRHHIDRACSECHDKHNVPGAKVVARFCQRKLPASTVPVCTDCHGRHKIGDKG